MSLFSQIPIYVKIYPNKFEITNLKNGRSVSRTSDIPFSNDRMTIADFNIAEQFGRTLIREVLDKSFFPPSFKILVQQMEQTEGGLAHIEKRALRDLSEQMGARFVKLIEHSRKLSEQEALLELDSK